MPPGDYEMTLDGLKSSILVAGPPQSVNWDATWRLKLVNNLEILAKQLWAIGITDIYINGSFVENRDRPNDIDGYFVCDLTDYVNGKIVQKLNSIDPYKAWGWDDSSRHPGRQLPLWHRYRVVLWPYSYGTMFGFDENNNLLEMSQAFRRTKANRRPKGIVRLKAPEILP